MATFQHVLFKLISLSISSIVILLVSHLFLFKNNTFYNIFNDGYSIFHGWKCGNIDGTITFSFSVIAAICLYIPSTLFCCLDYYLEQNNLLNKYKVSIPENKEKMTISWDKYDLAIKLVRFNSLMSVVVTPLLVIPIMEWRGVCDRFSLLDEGEHNTLDIILYILKILSIGFVSDILFYCAHRIMHEIKWFYQNIHKIHHTFNYTIAICASASHPLEHLLVNIFTVFGTPILLNMSCLGLFIYVWVAALATTFGHSGYDNPSNLLIYKFRKYTGNPHDYHHLYINCEYGSGYNEFMDTIFRTRIQDRFPKRWQKIKTQISF
eukprot:467851_1